jgi:hypothetical protein
VNFHAGSANDPKLTLIMLEFVNAQSDSVYLEPAGRARRASALRRAGIKRYPVKINDPASA